MSHAIYSSHIRHDLAATKSHRMLHLPSACLENTVAVYVLSTHDLHAISNYRRAAAEMVSGFLKSTSHNLRYVGIDSLARIVRINAKYAVEHQLAVIDCLEDPDDTLKKKTLELLYKMTKPGNVEVTAPLHAFC